MVDWTIPDRCNTPSRMTLCRMTLNRMTLCRCERVVREKRGANTHRIPGRKEPNWRLTGSDRRTKLSHRREPVGGSNVQSGRTNPGKSTRLSGSKQERNLDRKMTNDTNDTVARFRGTKHRVRRVRRDAQRKKFRISGDRTPGIRTMNQEDIRLEQPPK